MAKKSNVNVAPLVSETDGDFTIDWNGTEHRWSELPHHAKVYFARYGVSKSRQDTVSGLAAAINGTAKKPYTAEEITAVVEETGYAGDVSDKAALIAHATAYYQAQRWSDIMANQIGKRGPSGPRLSPEIALRYDVAETFLAPALKTAGKELPKSVREKRIALDEYMAKSEKLRVRVDAEVSRQLAAQADADDLDLVL